MNSSSNSKNTERPGSAHSGWLMLPILLAWVLGMLILFISFIDDIDHGRMSGFWVIPLILGFIAGVLCLTGFFTLQPNEARVLVLFGNYKGTVRTPGFHWGNPFYSRASVHDDGKTIRTKVSLRSRNFNGDKLKVNDKRGNPIEIAAVVVWRVRDTAQALFDVDDYETYVRVQAESALRHIASCYAYDQSDDDEPTLRSNADEVATALMAELQERLAKAGVEIEEARLMHLAYAQEIAQAMLRRQQAEAIIAARQKIVEGAVGMVEMALAELSAKDVVHLDDERPRWSAT